MKFLDILEESYRTIETKRKELKREEGHGTYYNVMKRKNGESNQVLVKQFTDKNQASAYANACNKKSNTHFFTIQKD